jgi:hypothetical protein
MLIFVLSLLFNQKLKTMTRITKITRKLMLPALAAIATLGAQAQDSTRTFVVSGSADGYYRYNFTAPGGATNNFTSFTNSQNSFELGMATLRADGTADGGKIAATADLGFGRRAEEFSYPDGSGGFGSATTGNGFNTLAAVKQLFISYTPGKLVTFTLGKWDTHIGYESVDAYNNKNYSMDYLFSYGPFSHTGFKAQYTKGNLGVMLGVANPIDNTTTTSGVKTLIAQVSDSVGKFLIYLNYAGFFGADHGANATNATYDTLKSLNQIDVVAEVALNSKWSLVDNFSTQFRTGLNSSSKTWVGDALYITYAPAATSSFTLRGEYISDSKYSLFPDKSIEDITLSYNYVVASRLTIIPEVRFDGSSDPIFYKSTDALGTPTATSTFTGLIAAVYKF